MTRDHVDQQILAAMEFIDDPLWCSRMADDLHLSHLQLQAFLAGDRMRIRLDVGGIPEPLIDPRVIRLVAAVRRYRRSDGVALYASDADWRLVVDTGDAFVFKPSGSASPLDSTVPVTDELLHELSTNGGVLASLFPSAEQVA